MLGLCALVALAITSCKKDETTKEMTFMATITQPAAEGRTHIDGNNNLVWDANNSIKVFNANGQEGNFTTSAQDVWQNAPFNGTIIPTDTYTAFYPNASVSGTNVVLTLKATQDFVTNNTFDDNTYPMVAVNNGNNFQFHSPAGVLRLRFTSDNPCTVGSIVLTGRSNNDVLAGNLVYAYNDADPNHYTVQNGTNTVTLDCGNGVALTSEDTYFNIVTLNCTFPNGFNVKVYDQGDNEIISFDAPASTDNQIKSEHILLMNSKPVHYELVSVFTDPATSITSTGATLNGHYNAPDGSTVTERGFYWSTVESDVIAHNSSCQKETLNGDGTPFSQALTGLTPGTYYFRAYAVNNTGENWGPVRQFTIEEPVPTVVTDEATGVTTTGEATLNAHYTANGATITEVGFYWSTSATNLNNKATVSGSTTSPFHFDLTGLTPGTYYFKAYVVTSTEIQADNVKQFTILQPAIPGAYSVSPTRLVVFAPANLQYNINPNASQSSTTSPMWRFAEHQYDVIGENANVQNAWDRFFYENNVTPENDPTVGNRYIDLFSWGTSGCPGSVQPWFMIRDSEPSNGQGIAMPGGTPNLGIGYSLGAPSNYTWYCPGHNDIAGTDNDWGQFNDIYNPRTGQIDQAGTWRTLTGSYYLDEHPENGEWYYLMHRRSASTVNGTANARYCKASINGVNGLILFPDEYTHPAGVAQPNSINESEVLCSVNTYTVADWNAMEAAYATFLPCGGTRHGWGVKENVWIDNPYLPYPVQLIVQGQDNYGGYYWSSSYRANMQAGTLRFLNANSGDQVNVNGGNNYNRELGCCVRLARTVRE